MLKKDRYKYILEYFEHTMPHPESELHYRNTFELLVAVVLSAQCTDKRVNQVTPALFEAYPIPQAMAQATPQQILGYISSVSYPNSKSQHLVGLAKGLCEQYGGVVPSDVSQMQTLPGVGRKTANVVAAVAFGLAAMPVDTHVRRVAARLGFVADNATPLATERELTANIPSSQLAVAHHWFLLHGRYTCTARAPHCMQCGISQWCKTFINNSNVIDEPRP